MWIKNTYHWCFAAIIVAGCSSGSTAEPSGKPDNETAEIIEKKVVGYETNSQGRFINNFQLYEEGWDTLAQALFWQDIIRLSHDSMILNVASVRQPLFKVSSENWYCQSQGEKDEYKKNVCISNNFDPSTEIYVTGGKKFFFEFKKALPMISKAIPVFEKYGTDPWFAQTILLIESPGKTEARSYVGARGPFQLMPYVARSNGLTVNKYRDDRTSLELSAGAAARFIGSVCIPQGRRILNDRNIAFNEHDLWFRLFVMHIYHAGAGNVEAVVNKINPQAGGMDLIRAMWVNQASGFKNESQNYSQIALAAIISFDRIISQDSETVYLVQGDKNMEMYFSRTAICVDTLQFLTSCLDAYESDLIDGVIPFEYFAASVLKVRKEIRSYCNRNNIAIPAEKYDAADRLLVLGNQLMYKRKFDEAVDVLQLSLETNPVSSSTCDSLGRAYRALGKTELAAKYSEKSKKILENPQAFMK